jgi:hypothetical protein
MSVASAIAMTPASGLSAAPQQVYIASTARRAASGEVEGRNVCLFLPCVSTVPGLEIDQAAVEEQFGIRDGPERSVR